LEESQHDKQGFGVSNASSPIHVESSAGKSFQELLMRIPRHIWRRLEIIGIEKLGVPKLIVAPMMDQSELPFRMLCRKSGATGACTPMFHSRSKRGTGRWSSLHVR